MANSASGESVTDRFVRILETFNSARTSQTVSEIGRRAGLPRSTAHRIVSDLVDAGLLERDADMRIRVGLRLWELATRSSSTLILRQAAQPSMERIRMRLGAPVQLVVRDEQEAVCLERLAAPESGSPEGGIQIAGRLPLHTSASGLVLLAFGSEELRSRVVGAPLRRMSSETITDPAMLASALDEIRLRGYAVSPGFVAPDGTGVAVPIRDRGGDVIAALSVVLARGRNPEPAILELRPAATAIARALGEVLSH